MTARLDWPNCHETELVHGSSRLVHLFDQEDVAAINAALAAHRPLLVRGEPGTGKSQLAEAAAAALGWELVAKSLDAATESRDLLWSYDAVGRLAEAQVASVTGRTTTSSLAERLDPLNFVTPGPLWFGLNWASGKAQADRRRSFVEGENGPDLGSSDTNPMAGSTSARAVPTGNGVVVLIDEVDKSDPSVPNGLLEVFGRERFECPFVGKPIERGANGLLVVLTTNEERPLPWAFLRRCFVHELRLPEGEDLIAYLVLRGKAHFPKTGAAVLEKAARLIARDRSERRADKEQPGQAEYLDLIRAVVEDDSGLPLSQQIEMLETVSKFVVRKHGQR